MRKTLSALWLGTILTCSASAQALPVKEACLPATPPAQTLELADKGASASEKEMVNELVKKTAPLVKSMTELNAQSDKLGETLQKSTGIDETQILDLFTQLTPLITSAVSKLGDSIPDTSLPAAKSGDEADSTSGDGADSTSGNKIDAKTATNALPDITDDLLNVLGGGQLNSKWGDVFNRLLPVLQDVLNASSQKSAKTSEEDDDIVVVESSEQTTQSTGTVKADGTTTETYSSNSSSARYDSRQTATASGQRRYIDYSSNTLWAHDCKLEIMDTERGLRVAEIDLPTDWIAGGRPWISTGTAFGVTLYHSSATRANAVWNVVVPLHKALKDVRLEELRRRNRNLFEALSAQFTQGRKLLANTSSGEVCEFTNAPSNTALPSFAPESEHKFAQISFRDTSTCDANGTLYATYYNSRNVLVEKDGKAYAIISAVVGDYPQSDAQDVEDMALANKLLDSEAFLLLQPDAAWMSAVLSQKEWTSPLEQGAYCHDKAIAKESAIILNNEFFETNLSDGQQIRIPDTDIHVWQGADGQILQINGEASAPSQIPALAGQTWTQLK